MIKIEIRRGEANKPGHHGRVVKIIPLKVPGIQLVICLIIAQFQRPCDQESGPGSKNDKCNNFFPVSQDRKLPHFIYQSLPNISPGSKQYVRDV
jgi:hypothetical protein